MKIFQCLLIFLGLFTLSCSENSVNESPAPYIYEVSSADTFIGDTITFYGSGFNSPSDSCRIIYGDSMFINSIDCIKWTWNVIRFEITEELVSTTYSVVSYSDTSNKVEINVSVLPEIELVEVNANTFNMGSTAGFEDELPVHKVVISKDFLIGKFEVSKFLWKLVMGNNPNGYTGKNYPADSIDWIDAVLFCNKLSIMSGLDSCYAINNDDVQWDRNTNGYRLPTEAEWEMAAKGGIVEEFSGKAAEDVAWFNTTSGYKPHPSGQKSANGYEIYDMNGNILEWCWDLYSKKYYSDSLFTDPVGPVSGTRRVLKGGSWASGKTLVRAAARSFDNYDILQCGFRIVRNK